MKANRDAEVNVGDDVYVDDEGAGIVTAVNGMAVSVTLTGGRRIVASYATVEVTPRQGKRWPPAQQTKRPR